MIKIIEEFLKSRVSSVLRCFIVQNSIIIETNYKGLYQDFKRYFEPFFSVEYNSTLEERNFKIKAFTLDELQLINLFASLTDGVETYQFLGEYGKKMKWITVSEENFIISYNSYFRSIVVQEKNENKNIMIISSELFISKVLGKIIKEEILYSSPLKLTLKSSMVLKHDSKGILFLGTTSNFYSTVFEFIRFNSPIIISLSKTIIQLENNELLANGTPELLTINKTNNKLNDYFHNTDGPNKIGPKDIANIFNINLSKNTKVRKIIFDDNEMQIPPIKKINALEVKGKLHDYLIQNENNHLTPWIPLNSVGNSSNAYKNINDFALNIPSYSVNFNKLNIEDFNKLIHT